MRTTFLLGTALSFGLAGAATAGGLQAPQQEPVTIAPAPVAATTPDWTGFYFGGQYGGADVDTSGAATVGGDGDFFGLHAGYQWDFGTTVIGAEIDYDDADIDLDGGAGTIDDIARLRFRGGYDFGNGFLGYGALGVVTADATIGGTEFSDTGWLAGLGVNYDLGNSVILGGDVTYHEFDDFDDTGIDVDVTTFSARVSYRF